MMNEQQYAGQDIDGSNAAGCPFINQTLDIFTADQIATFERLIGSNWRELIAADQAS